MSTQNPVYVFVTLFGELIGRMPASMLDSDEPMLVEQPMKLGIVPTAQGMSNVLVPISQFVSVQALELNPFHVVLVSEAPKHVSDAYISATSGIKLATSNLILGA